MWRAQWAWRTNLRKETHHERELKRVHTRRARHHRAQQIRVAQRPQNLQTVTGDRKVRVMGAGRQGGRGAGRRHTAGYLLRGSPLARIMGIDEGRKECKVEREPRKLLVQRARPELSRLVAHDG